LSGLSTRLLRRFASRNDTCVSFSVLAYLVATRPRYLAFSGRPLGRAPTRSGVLDRSGEGESSNLVRISVVDVLDVNLSRNSPPHVRPGDANSQ